MTWWPSARRWQKHVEWLSCHVSTRNNMSSKWSCLTSYKLSSLFSRQRTLRLPKLRRRSGSWEWRSNLSGVPWCSVLSPILFALHIINDIDSCINNKELKFENDLIILLWLIHSLTVFIFVICLDYLHWTKCQHNSFIICYVIILCERLWLPCNCISCQHLYGL